MRELTFKDKKELNRKAHRHGLPTLWPEADTEKILLDIGMQQARMFPREWVGLGANLRQSGSIHEMLGMNPYFCVDPPSRRSFLAPPPRAPWHRWLWPF